MPIIYMADGPEVGDSTEPPFTLHVPGGETLQFHSYEEVAVWAGKEEGRLADTSGTPKIPRAGRRTGGGCSNQRFQAAPSQGARSFKL